MKVTSNTLKQLFISFFYLPLLVLAGCSGYKGSLGVQPTENDAPSQAQRSNTQIIVDGAGYIGEFTSGLVAGALGAVPFSIGGGCYSACKGASIGQGVSDGAASGAYYGYYTGAYVGRHTARIATAALILGGLYAWQGVGWLASNTYNGIKYFTAAGVDGTASDDEDSLVNPNLVSDFPSSSPEGFWGGLVHFLV